MAGVLCCPIIKRLLQQQLQTQIWEPELLWLQVITFGMALANLHLVVSVIHSVAVFLDVRIFHIDAKVAEE